MRPALVAPAAQATHVSSGVHVTIAFDITTALHVIITTALHVIITTALHVIMHGISSIP